MKRLQSEDGFTFLELLISLAILAMISIMITGAMIYTRQVWDRGTTFAAYEHQALLRDSLRRWLQNLDDDKAIRGEQNGVEFTVLWGDLPRADLYELQVKLDVIRNQTSDDLVVRLTGLDIDDQVVLSEQRVLLNDMRDLRIRYFGKPAPTRQWGWYDDWRFENPNLKLIRIDAAHADGRAWPPLVVRVGLSFDQRKISASSLVPPF
jgi:prepilin-type N-terminal cleavage/methylation domain-containing protein